MSYWRDKPKTKRSPHRFKGAGTLKVQNLHRPKRGYNFCVLTLKSNKPYGPLRFFKTLEAAKIFVSTKKLNSKITYLIKSTSTVRQGSVSIDTFYPPQSSLQCTDDESYSSDHDESTM